MQTDDGLIRGMTVAEIEAIGEDDTSVTSLSGRVLGFIFGHLLFVGLGFVLLFVAGYFTVNWLGAADLVDLFN